MLADRRRECGVDVIELTSDLLGSSQPLVRRPGAMLAASGGFPGGVVGEDPSDRCADGRSWRHRAANDHLPERYQSQGALPRCVAIALRDGLPLTTTRAEYERVVIGR